MIAHGAALSNPYPDRLFPPALMPSPVTFVPVQLPASTIAPFVTLMPATLFPDKSLFCSSATPVSTDTPTPLPVIEAGLSWTLAEALVPRTYMPVVQLVIVVLPLI